MYHCFEVKKVMENENCGLHQNHFVRVKLGLNKIVK